MKKLYAFDLDNTLAESKQPISKEMSDLLGELLQGHNVAIISGAKWKQFKLQIIDRLSVDSSQLSRLHLMPTCGTRYYRYSEAKSDWRLEYAEDLDEDDRLHIIQTLIKGAAVLGFAETETWGDIIEDRGSQITFSALGQQAPPEAKNLWDPDKTKKNALRDWVSARLPEFQVRTGGSTSIDVTSPGIDKAYGMNMLVKALGISLDEVLFVGDNLQEGGNDYPVKAMGVDCIAVNSYEKTPGVIRTLLRQGL